MLIEKRKFLKSSLPGALLLELLVVIGLFAILVPIVAQVVVVSLNANKIAVENMVASGLIEEAIVAVENNSFSSWSNIYGLNKGAANHYYPVKSGGAWIIMSGDESVVVNGKTYTRYFTVSNVCRDNSTANIITSSGVPPCTAGNSDDPSTQMISIVISWDGQSVVKKAYLTRWRNKACLQTDWTAPGSGPLTCPSTLYDSLTNIDTTSAPGSLRIQAN